MHGIDAVLCRTLDVPPGAEVGLDLIMIGMPIHIGIAIRSDGYR